MLEALVASVLTAPFAAILIVIALSRKSKKIAELLAIATGVLELLLGVCIVVEYYKRVEEGVRYILIDYTSTLIPLNLGVKILPFNVLLDPLSVLMTLVVTLISAMVFIFSKGYMHGDKRLIRYYCFLLLFVGGMLLLVLAGNFLFLYMGWEIVGLCSCLLIGHWYERPEASKAGVKAFVTTRLGDTLFFASIALIAQLLGSLNYLDFAAHVHELKPFLALILLLALGGAVGKSAQVPLHVWLPDAMEGPTTVSALIHAATMVKAGVYLVARLETLIMFYPRVLGLTITAHDLIVATPFFMAVTVIGTVTAFLAATMAITAMDIKRVLAYSTLSQLGYMFAALGLAGFIHEPWEAWYAGMFHLLNHAIFKALLFLSAGSVIHAVESRDMLRMGGLSKYMPITSKTMIIGGLCLAGLVPFNGFWSKDLIIEVSAISGLHLVNIALTVTALLTAAYTFRMIYLTFFAPPSEHVKKHPPHESPPVMTIPLIVLAILAATSGLVEEFASPFKHVVLEAYGLAHHISHGGYGVQGTQMLKLMTSALSTAFVLIATYLIVIVYHKRKIPPERILKVPALAKIREVLVNGYYFDYIYEKKLVPAIVSCAANIAWLVERSLNCLNLLIAKSAVLMGYAVRRTHTGRISTYFMSTFLGLIILLLVAIAVVWGM